VLGGVPRGRGLLVDMLRDHNTRREFIELIAFQARRGRNSLYQCRPRPLGNGDGVGDRGRALFGDRERPRFYLLSALKYDYLTILVNATWFSFRVEKPKKSPGAIGRGE